MLVGKMSVDRQSGTAGHLRCVQMSKSQLKTAVPKSIPFLVSSCLVAGRTKYAQSQDIYTGNAGIALNCKTAESPTTRANLLQSRINDRVCF